jgi:zinc/manganese transport system ATP-binding protein
MQPLLEVHDLTCGYANEVTFQEVNLRLYTGQLSGLIGPSGSG